jgi:hypothetical protein
MRRALKRTLNVNKKERKECKIHTLGKEVRVYDVL